MCDLNRVRWLWGGHLRMVRHFALVRCAAAAQPLLEVNQMSPARARNDVNDPERTSASPFT